MINAGFNPLQTISEKTGKSIAQLKEEMSKGAISAEMVQQAFLDATSAGGKFYNMSENASKTINGQISMLQDAMDAVFNEIGTKTEGIIIKTIQAGTELIQNYETIGKVLVGLVATYGAYRTAVLLSTAATSKHTIAEIALTNVRIAARKAQLALNAAMLTNPYVAATVAIAGLASAMWVLNDNTAKAERRQKAYDEAKENAAQKEKEHADAVQELIDKVRDNTQADAERIIALDALKNEYPNIFAQYDIESLKLADILKLKKQINEEDTRRKNFERGEEIADLDAQIAKLREAKKYAGQSAASIQSQIDDLMFQRDQKVEEQRQSSIADFTGKLSGKSMEELKAYMKQLDSKAFKLDGKAITPATRDTLKKAVQDAIDDINEASKSFYSDDYNEAKKQWEDAKKAFEEVEKDKDKYTTAEFNERKATLEDREKKFKALGGDTTGKTDKNVAQTYNEQLAQQEKISQMQTKADIDRARTAKDMGFMVEQARIDAMKDGSEKKRAQMALDHKKELENLERQKQDYIQKAIEQEKAVFDAREDEKAKNDKTYKKQTFDASSVKVDTKAYDDAMAYTTAKQVTQQGEAVKALTERYMAYEDKKKKLEEEYLNDIIILNGQYLETGDEQYKRSLDERYKAYVQSMNQLEKELGSDDYKLIFGDPERMTSSTIDKALEAARKKLAGLNKEADPETFKALSDAIERLEDARDSNPFQGWDTSVMGLVQKLYQIRNIRKDIAKYEKEGNKEAAEASKGQLEKSKKDLNKALIGTGVSQFGDALSTAAATMKEVAKASGDIHLEQQAEALEKASGFVSSVASGAASGGWIGAIVGGATSLMNMLVSSITESKIVAAEAKKAYEDYLEELSHTARTIKDEDYETIFGVRALEKVVAASKAAAQALGDYNDILNKDYDDIVLKTQFFFGSRETDRYAQEGLGNNIVKLGSKNKKDWTTLADAFPDLFDSNGNLVLEQAEAILGAYSKYSGEDWYKNLEDATQALKDYEENLAIVDDYLVSLFSNVGSEIADAIMQGNDALEVLEDNAGRIFASIAKDMIMSVLMSSDFIEEYKKKLRDAMATEDVADDADVLADFVVDYSENIDKAKAAWEQIKAIAEEKGIEMDFDGSDTQQNATSRGYQTLSEDTGNELVGRALAQYESNLRMEEAMRATKESVDIMAGNQVQIRDIAAESRALIADSYLELQQIRENTGAIIKPIKNLSDKIDRWDNKIMGL